MSEHDDYAKDSPWASLQAYVVALGRWGWVVVGEIGLGVVGAVLDVAHVTHFPTQAWLTLILTGLIAPPFIAFHKLRLKRNELGREATVKPHVTVSIEPSWPDGVARLRIENKGGKGTFSACAQRMLHGCPNGPEWDVRWEGSFSRQQQISKNDHRFLQLVSMDWTAPPARPLAKFHTVEKEHLESSILDRTEHKISSYYHQVVPDNGVIEIEVRIVSDPELSFLCKPGYLVHLAEDGVSITEKAGGSQ